jgi:hypothetical protein
MSVLQHLGLRRRIFGVLSPSSAFCAALLMLFSLSNAAMAFSRIDAFSLLTAARLPPKVYGCKRGTVAFA